MLPRNLWGVLRGDGDRWRAAARRCSFTMRIIWLEPQVHEARVVVVHRHLSLWAALGVKSIDDLGSWKFAAAAHAIARARRPTRPSTSSR